jgi:hypothetical protein
VADVSLRGARLHADTAHRPGERLTLELFTPAGRPIVAGARVAWVQPLPPDSLATYALGVEFTDLAPADAHRLRVVLEHSGW